MSSYGASSENDVCYDGHRFYIYDRALTADNTFHSFAICTRCGKEWHKMKPLGADVLWVDGSHPSEVSKES